VLPKLLSALTLMTLVALAATPPADAQIPTVADVAACNEEAPKSVKARTTSPTVGDHARADRARNRVVTSGSSPAIESSDPQIHGMNVDGAIDATYQAAYRTCMRRKGF